MRWRVVLCFQYALFLYLTFWVSAVVMLLLAAVKTAAIVITLVSLVYRPISHCWNIGTSHCWNIVTYPLLKYWNIPIAEILEHPIAEILEHTHCWNIGTSHCWNIRTYPLLKYWNIPIAEILEHPIAETSPLMWGSEKMLCVCILVTSVTAEVTPLNVDPPEIRTYPV